MIIKLWVKKQKKCQNFVLAIFEKIKQNTNLVILIFSIRMREKNNKGIKKYNFVYQQNYCIIINMPDLETRQCSLEHSVRRKHHHTATLPP